MKRRRPQHSGYRGKGRRTTKKGAVSPSVRGVRRGEARVQVQVREAERRESAREGAGGRKLTLRSVLHQRLPGRTELRTSGTPGRRTTRTRSGSRGGRGKGVGRRHAHQRRAVGSDSSAAVTRSRAGIHAPRRPIAWRADPFAQLRLLSGCMRGPPPPQEARRLATASDPSTCCE